MKTITFLQALNLLLTFCIYEPALASQNETSTDHVITIKRSLIIGTGRNAAMVYPFLPFSDLPRPLDITVDLAKAAFAKKYEKYYSKPDIETFVTGSKGMAAMQAGIKDTLLIDEPTGQFDLIWFQRIGWGLLEFSIDRCRHDGLFVNGMEPLGYPEKAKSPLTSTMHYLTNLATMLKPGGVLLYQSFRHTGKSDALRKYYAILWNIKCDLEADPDNEREKSHPAYDEIMNLSAPDILANLPPEELYMKTTSSLQSVYTKFFKASAPLFTEVTLELIEEKDWASTLNISSSWYAQLRAVYKPF